MKNKPLMERMEDIEQDFIKAIDALDKEAEQIIFGSRVQKEASVSREQDGRPNY